MWITPNIESLRIKQLLFFWLRRNAAL
jgi:hypothetical protein